MPRKPTCECGDCSKCKHRERARQRYWTDADYRAKAIASSKAVRDRNIEYYREYDRARGYREYDAEKARARRKVNHEIAAGRLERQPCQVCGEPQGHAHHPDHSKPLEVIWLCREHHGQVHRRLPSQREQRMAA